MTSLSKNKRRENSKNLNIIKYCTNFGQLHPLNLPHLFIPKDLRIALQNNLKANNGTTAKGRNYIQFLQNLSQVENVEQDNYLLLFKTLLYVEDFAKRAEMAKHDIKKQTIKQYLNNKTTFDIDVPTLNIDDPFLKVDDSVWIRGITNTASRNMSCKAKIIKISDRGISAVVSDDFAKEHVKDNKYNVSFECEDWNMKSYHYVLHIVNRYDLVSLMYPTIRNNHIKPKLDLCWFNKLIGINPEQKQAIVNILNKTAYPAPYVLFGPPGTGKTATLVELICQIWKQGNSKCVLVCGPSNASVDEMAIRLLKYINPNEVHRMYSRSKKWLGVPSMLKPCANFSEDIHIFLPKDILLFKRIILVTLSTCARLLKGKFRENHFSYIIIDEASQAIEPETIIPFMLACTKNEAIKGSLLAQVVIAGDHHQLGPVVVSKIAKPLLGISMLERLMNLPLYKKGKDNKYDPYYVTKLIRNYRSHKCILHVPNEEFYNGELIACGGAVINAAIGWPMLPNVKFPLIFHSAVGREQRQHGTHSVYNSKEILITLEYVKLLMSSKLGTLKVTQEHLGVITPFRLQQNKLKNELQNRGWNDIEVGTVEIFQGREKAIIILTTVRSRIFKHDGKKHIGFLSSEKRFNVALTRAKSLLIVIGNPMVLGKNKCWRSLMQYCIDNQAYIGDPCAF